MVQFSGLSGEQALAEVYDLTGMKVFSGIYHTEDGTLNEKLYLDHLPAGSYLLRMTSGEDLFLEQLIITH